MLLLIPTRFQSIRRLILGKDVIQVHPKGPVPEGIQRCPGLTVHDLLRPRSAPFAAVNHDVALREVVSERPQQYHVGIQNHDDDVLVILIVVVLQPVLQPMPQPERFIVVLVTVPRYSAEIGREVHRERIGQFGNVRALKGQQLSSLLLGASRGDAYDVARLTDLGGEVEEHEGLPVLGGRAGRGERGVVRGE